MIWEPRFWQQRQWCLFFKYCLQKKKRRDLTSQIIAKQMILDKCSAEEVWNEWSHDGQSYKDAKLEQVYAQIIVPTTWSFFYLFIRKNIIHWHHAKAVKGTLVNVLLGRMGKSFGCSDFWDRLGGQALVVIGRWYSRQPLLTNHK